MKKTLLSNQELSDTGRICFQKVERDEETFIDFRRQFKEGDEWLFTKKGLHLTREQFHEFRLIVDEIDDKLDT